MRPLSRRCFYVFVIAAVASVEVWRLLWTDFVQTSKDPWSKAILPHKWTLKETRGTVNYEDHQKALQKMLNTPNNATFPKVTAVDCPILWAGNVDADYLSKADSITRPGSTGWARDLPRETSNCTRYLLNRGFRLADVSEEELSFPIAFSLMVYTDFWQVERLLRAIYRPHNVYCLHVDLKSHAVFKRYLRLIASCLPNVFILDKAFNVTWGQYSVVEPELKCMTRLLSHAVRWRYFINLTGQEFPLKTNKELVKILNAFRGANDITGSSSSMWTERWLRELPAPFNLTLVKGSKLIVASRGYVDYVINSRVSRNLRMWVRYTYIPDETFFATLNFNPKLGVPGSYLGIANSSDQSQGHFTRYVVWTESGVPCAGTYVRWVCVFGVGDLPRLTQSPRLFANKFYYYFRPVAYDCLEEWYFYKVHLENVGRPLVLNLSLYEHADFVKHAYTGPIKIG